MVTFFTIFFILILVNVGLILHSIVSARPKRTSAAKPVTDQPEIKIYPLDLLSPGYKKAI